MCLFASPSGIRGTQYKFTRWLRPPGPKHRHTPYLLKKKKNDKVVAIKVNKQANNGVKRFWVPKEIISNIKSTKKVWILKGK